MSDSERYHVVYNTAYNINHDRERELEAVVKVLKTIFHPYCPHYQSHEWEYVAAEILGAAENARHASGQAASKEK